VYRRKLTPDHGLLDFSLYVTFFPQLVAGPIVRANSFLPQCDRAPEFRLHEFVWGIYLLLFGLFAKVVLADFILAPVTETAFFSPANNTTLDAWLGMFAFSGQIFFDFGGYTLCALGCAMLLGFTLPDNFRSPYAAIGFSDFWRRWHISLSSWLRDYLYIALGGNRKGRVRTLGNLMVTMFLGGLWHGASWNFVLWGGLHGFFLVAEHGLSNLTKFRPDGRFVKALMILLTFLLVSLVWVPFRAVDIHASLDFYRIMFSLNAGTSFDTANIAVVVAVIVATLLWHAYTRQQSLEARFTPLPVWLRVVILSGMIISVGLCSTGDSRAFIYFQF
jgi:alginate O-acetyltransferase complex protein AlgI